MALKRAESEANHSPLSIAQVSNEWSVRERVMESVLKFQVFWYMTSRRSINRYLLFGEACYFHLQGHSGFS
jgi:hypothetical protein